MKVEFRHHRPVGLAFILLLAPTVFLAAAPAVPEPKVTAAIEPVAGQPSSCIVTVAVRTPDTDEALAAPSFRVRPGKPASASTTDSAHKVAVAIEAGPDCIGGTYDVKVHAGGALVLAKAGTLQPRAQ